MKNELKKFQERRIDTDRSKVRHKRREIKKEKEAKKMSERSIVSERGIKSKMSLIEE